MKYDELKTVEEIKALPLGIKNHLSHVIRNGIMTILSAHSRGEDVEAELQEFEKRIAVLGL